MCFLWFLGLARPVDGGNVAIIWIVLYLLSGFYLKLHPQTSQPPPPKKKKKIISSTIFNHWQAYTAWLYVCESVITLAATPFIH